MNKIIVKPNKREDIKKLVDLEKLSLPKDYFTFKDFSYLKSKLVNVSKIS